jgi:uncharacterized integral membrane protein
MAKTKVERTDTDWVRSPRFWVGVVIAAISLAFILQNRAPVAINLTWLSVTAPLWVTLAAVFVAGFLAGLLIARRRSR